MKNRWGAYNDYAREVDEETERGMHRENQENGNDCEPWCPYCADEKKEAKDESN
jgi:hypothetical protein